MPQIRVHDLRHTTATVLLEAGAHPKLLQDLLGHSTVALTLNAYSHVTAGPSDQYAKTMDRVIGDQKLKAGYRLDCALADSHQLVRVIDTRVRTVRPRSAIGR